MGPSFYHSDWFKGERVICLSHQIPRELRQRDGLFLLDLNLGGHRVRVLAGSQPSCPHGEPENQVKSEESRAEGAKDKQRGNLMLGVVPWTLQLCESATSLFSLGHDEL